MSIKEVKVPNLPQVYRLVEISKNGKERLSQRFRVRKRIKTFGRWTTRVQTFDSFEEAKHYAKYGAASIEQENLASNSKLFRDVFERFLTHKEIKERLSEGSLDGYRNRAKHYCFFETMVMSEITPKAVDAWLDLLFSAEYLNLQQKSRVNYEHEYFLLSGIFTYFRNHEDETFQSPLLKRHREIACKRARAVEEVEIRYLSLQEEEIFLAFLNDSVFRDLAFFQLHTGARVGEAAALEFNNIDFATNEVRLANHLHWERKKGSKIKLLPGTKGGPARRGFLTPECRAMLWRRKQSSDTPLVFGSREGTWLTYRAIQSAFDRSFRRMSIPHRGTHTLRHTFAVRFLEQTKDIHALQKLLGHRDLKDTLRYAKYTNESVKRSFRLFRGGLAENEGFVPQLVPQH